MSDTVILKTLFLTRTLCLIVVVNLKEKETWAVWPSDRKSRVLRKVKCLKVPLKINIRKFRNRDYL